MHYRYICDICVDGVREGGRERGKEKKDSARRPFYVKIRAAVGVICPQGDAYVVSRQVNKDRNIVNGRGDRN